MSIEDFILVDVEKSYSHIKELMLQEFMDVEYIPLESNDDFLNQGFVQAIGKKFIIVINYIDDGDIFIYDRAGKALRKINHKGQGGEEYTGIYNLILDEDNNEIFVNNHFQQKIIVYDLYGNFKRCFKYKGNYEDMFYTDIFNFDKYNLICYDQYNKDIPFVIVSKQNGSITKKIKIPFKEKKILQQVLKDEVSGAVTTMIPGHHRSIIPFKNSWLLLEHSSDTVYNYLPDNNSLQPFLVRTPTIQSMYPEIFLMLRFISDRYIFMETTKNVYDWNTGAGFPRTYFMYDTQKKAISGYKVYNGDYIIKKEVYMNILRPVNHEIESYQSLKADQLVESYQKGELKGKLKDIAAKLNEESNPVIMLVKHKIQI